jgi:hypothetical protein
MLSIIIPFLNPEPPLPMLVLVQAQLHDELQRYDNLTKECDEKYPHPTIRSAHCPKLSE